MKSVFYLSCLVITLLLLYGWGRDQRQQEAKVLKEELLSLDQAIQQQQKHFNQLKDELASQSDPAWVELTLMKVLGVVPPQTKKIIFKRPEE